MHMTTPVEVDSVCPCPAANGHIVTSELSYHTHSVRYELGGQTSKTLNTASSTSTLDTVNTTLILDTVNTTSTL